MVMINFALISLCHGNYIFRLAPDNGDKTTIQTKAACTIMDHNCNAQAPQLNCYLHSLKI